METELLSNSLAPSRKRTVRPSLLSQVQLSDGQLAWPVASAAGISEPTFRARLKAGLSPDAAASTPIAKRGPSRVADRGVVHSARAPVPARPSSERLASTADGYSGVIWHEGDFRLIVSPRGANYALQVQGTDGTWELEREFPSASFLGHWLHCIAIDPSPALLEAAAGLPDNPASSGFAPYRRAAF